MATTDARFVLTLDCPDQPGIVHAVTGFLVERGANILESQQYGDAQSGRFLLRMDVSIADGAGVSAAGLAADFAPVAERFSMTYDVWDTAVPRRVLVMVSRHLHCLNDLLFRHSTGTLPVEIPLVVSNHPDAEALARHHGRAFVHLPVTPETKPQAEAALLDLVEEHRIDLVVLARYMQVLSDDLCRRLEGRAINIHHSFLPSFKGAKPYHQAFDRGVKLVGATAHYVTADLDEGPIIEQDVLRVDHAHDQAAMVAAGRDVEAQVLSRAVRWHAESRVLRHGHRTVVFR
ncbi:formyltetrahydrofolate deformylase [Nocardioides taihuensis]|uniref:Formyltetrahydrofolate deformylase n=1 Tax=Nocardioides taihuensis TaxID=1835606 RepID=A0ABW0BFZ4_9ACTN